MRFVATLGALAALAGLIWLAVPDHTNTLVPVASGVNERRVDLLNLVFKTTAQQGFAVQNGRTTKQMELILDSSRRMRIPPGTPAVVTCPKMGELAQCAVAADLLGESVVWFALVPALNRPTIVLPPIAEMRKNNEVLLANGWLIKRSAVIDRACDTETDSLTDFFNRFGNRHSTTFSYTRQQITRVTCTGAAAPDTTEPAATVAGTVPPPPPTVAPPAPVGTATG